MPHRDSLYVDHGDDRVVARMDDDDLLVHDEVEVSAPSRMDFDDRRGHRDELHAVTRDRHADAQVDIDVGAGDAGHVAALQHRAADLGLLLAGEVDRAARAVGLALRARLLAALATLRVLAGLLAVTALALALRARLLAAFATLRVLAALLALTLALRARLLAVLATLLVLAGPLSVALALALHVATPLALALHVALALTLCLSRAAAAHAVLTLGSAAATTTIHAFRGGRTAATAAAGARTAASAASAAAPLRGNCDRAGNQGRSRNRRQQGVPHVLPP